MEGDERDKMETSRKTAIHKRLQAYQDGIFRVLISEYKNDVNMEAAKEKQPAALKESEE